MITFSQSGDFDNTFDFLKKSEKQDVYSILEKYGKIGVSALQEATPKDTGNTADSWSYEVRRTLGGYRLYFINTSETSTGIPIVILLQYGHGLSGGGYVEGRDFINPTLQPIFDDITKELWEEIKSN